MAFSEEFIYQLRQANPIESVAASYAELKRSGSDYKCCCPFHSEKTPSCYIHPIQQYFHCFGCNVGGDVITFVKLAENLDYVEAVKFLAQRANIPMPEDSFDDKSALMKSRCFEINRQTANYYYKCLFSDEGKAARAYLANRGIRAETVKKFGLGYSPNSWDSLKKHLLSLGFNESELLAAGVVTQSSKQGATSRSFDFFRARVMFPIVDLRGNVIAFGARRIDGGKESKYLNSRENLIYRKGRHLFALNIAKKSDAKRLILTEGYMDTVSLHQAGFDNACAILGTAMTAEQARIVKPYCDEIILALDSDSAGQSAIARTINILSEVGIRTRVLRLHDAKDPDEFIKKFGSDEFKRILNHSGDAVNFQLERCMAGLDLQTESGKSEYLKRCVKILADINNPIEREVYTSRLANEMEINPAVLSNSVAQSIKSRDINRNRKQRKNIVSTIMGRDIINPQSATMLRQSRAEEEIIAYLLRFRDEAEDIERKIPPDMFVTDFNKRLYELLLGAIIGSNDFCLSMLAGELTPGEMGRITGIEAKFSGIPLGEKQLAECVRTLTDYHTFAKVHHSGDISDEELLEIAQAYSNSD